MGANNKGKVLKGEEKKDWAVFFFSLEQAVSSHDLRLIDRGGDA